MDLLELAVAEELDLAWHDDPTRYPYLRQTTRLCYKRVGVIGQGDSWSTGARVVGYSQLQPSALKQYRDKWVRRVFWCKLADRDGTRVDPPMREAVDPRVIQERVLTPWLFDYDIDAGAREAWLRGRRAQLGLADGHTVSPGPELTPRQPVR